MATFTKGGTFHYEGKTEITTYYEHATKTEVAFRAGKEAFSWIIVKGEKALVTKVITAYCKALASGGKAETLTVEM